MLDQADPGAHLRAQASRSFVPSHTSDSCGHGEAETAGRREGQGGGGQPGTWGWRTGLFHPGGRHGVPLTQMVEQKRP